MTAYAIQNWSAGVLLAILRHATTLTSIIAAEATGYKHLAAMCAQCALLTPNGGSERL